MNPRNDPNGWRRSYVETSAVRSDDGWPIGAIGRFALSFLISFGAAHAALAAILERLA